MSMLHLDDREVSAAGKSYGYWWYADPFDNSIDKILVATNKTSSHPRIAIDIGCAVGERSLNLATLGVFSEVIACDIEDRTGDMAEHGRRRKPPRNTGFQAGAGEITTPVRFLLAGINDIQPMHFENESIGFINCRNVPHFLTPVEFRHGLGNIARVAKPGTFVAISFDAQPNAGGPYYSLFDNVEREDFTERYRGYRKSLGFDPHGDNSPRGIYDEQEVRSYMRKLGFVTLRLREQPQESGEWWEDTSPPLRNNEARIFAVRQADANAFT